MLDMHKKLRLITLHHQGLTSLAPFGKGIQATRRAIEHLGYIQIDTLSVVERAHHHILWTRIPDYQPDYLTELIRERSVFEYWFHAASILPMEDFRFVLPQMSAIRRGESPYSYHVDCKHIHHVLDRIRCEGPLRARDFKSPTRVGAKWWEWKPAKPALEKLFMQGDLMITSRDGMEKVYDLTERVLPDSTDTREPTIFEFSEYLIDVALKAYGLTTLKQLTHLRTGKALRNALDEILCRKVAERTLVACHVEGMPKVYATPAVLDAKNHPPNNNVRLLSPFDNAIIHRDKLQHIFDFEYKLECYLPKEKRKFGYFSLPVLYKDRLVARVDCKAHRNTRCLELIHFHLESKDVDLEAFLPKFAKAVHRFSVFNACDVIQLTNSRPASLKGPLRSALNAI